MQRRIAESSGVRVRLLERTDAADGVTLMEVYEDIEDATRFGAVLADAVQAARFDADAVAARRIERFQDV